MNMLEVDSVFHSYGRGPMLLSGIALSVDRGRVAVLLGRNGTGKTTLLHLICGLRGDRGAGSGMANVRIAGRSVPVRGRSRWISLLPQDCCLPKDARVARCLQLSLGGGAMAAALERFPPLAGLLGRRIKQLSGGESRIVELACVLFRNRPVLLLDEPFRQMEPLHADMVQRILREEAETRAILLTDHLYRDALRIADRVLLLKGGYLEEVGSTDPSSLRGYLPEPDPS